MVDQVLKNLVLQNSSVFPLEIIPSFFKLSYVRNTGGAWGIFGNSTWLLIIISAIVVIILNQYLLKETHFSKSSIWAYGLFMGGLLGNLIDRMMHNFVIDYLDFTISTYDFPVFNLADIAIVVGIGILLIDVLRGEINEYSNRSRKHKN